MGASAAENRRRMNRTKAGRQYLLSGMVAAAVFFASALSPMPSVAQPDRGAQRTQPSGQSAAPQQEKAPAGRASGRAAGPTASQTEQPSVSRTQGQRPVPPPPGPARAQPSTEASSDETPLTAAQQGQAQTKDSLSQADQSMEGVAVDPELLRKPMNTLQIAGWSSLLGGLALGAGASALLNAAQTSEGSAQRILRRFDETSGAHPIYAGVQTEYNKHLNRAAIRRSSALALSITAGVAFLTGVTLAIVGATQRKGKEPRIHGLSLRF